MYLMLLCFKVLLVSVDLITDTMSVPSILIVHVVLQEQCTRSIYFEFSMLDFQ